MSIIITQYDLLPVRRDKQVGSGISISGGGGGNPDAGPTGGGSIGLSGYVTKIVFDSSISGLRRGITDLDASIVVTNNRIYTDKVITDASIGGLRIRTTDLDASVGVLRIRTTDLASLDSTASTKLAGIAAGAQVNTINSGDGLNALDSTANTKLAGIAAGADVTSANTAAGIAGQGTLATKSSVDLNSAEVSNKSLANVDSTANTKLAGIAAGATVGATWGTNITSQPSTLNAIESGTGTKLAGIAAGAQVNTINAGSGLAALDTSSNTKLVGIEAEATRGATWGVNMGSIPAYLVAPGSAGLHISSNCLGYYNGSAWTSYIDNAGNCAFTGVGSFKMATVTETGHTMGISISGDDIYENFDNAPSGTIFINRKGYNGGNTQYRQLIIGDGVGGNILSCYYDGTTYYKNMCRVWGNLLADNGVIADIIYAYGNISGLSFTDRTPFYKGDAIKELSAIKGIDGKIDHSTLPVFVQKDITTIDKKTKVETISQERDLGAMISMLTVAVQQLNAKIEILEAKTKILP